MGFIRHTVTFQVFRDSTLRWWGFSPPCCTQGTSKMCKGQQRLTEGGASSSKVSSPPCSAQELDQDKPSGAFKGCGVEMALV